MIKDPDANLDYVFDWAPLTNGRPQAKSDWLATSETITAATVTADSGITVADVSFTDSMVTAWLSGGTAGKTYTVRCRITTSMDRIDDRSIEVGVEDR